MTTAKRNEHLKKVRRVRAWVKTHGYEAALLTTQNNFSWITATGNAQLSLGDDSAIAYILAEHVLRAGQAPAWNPSMTGSESEDTIIVREDSPDVLSQTDDWPALEVELAGPPHPETVGPHPMTAASAT